MSLIFHLRSLENVSRITRIIDNVACLDEERLQDNLVPAQYEPTVMADAPSLTGMSMEVYSATYEQGRILHPK